MASDPAEEKPRSPATDSGGSPVSGPTMGVPTVTATTAADASGLILGGKYKLIERIGEGAMGSVWLAQQSEPVKRKVAVKLIKLGMDSRQVIARFEAERQALAMMDNRFNLLSRLRLRESEGADS